MVSGSTESVPRLSPTHLHFFLFFNFISVNGQRESRKGTIYYYILFLDFQLAASHGDIYKFLWTRYYLIMCHQNLCHLEVWGTRSEEGVALVKLSLWKLCMYPNRKITLEVCWIYNFKNILSKLAEPGVSPHWERTMSWGLHYGRWPWGGQWGRQESYPLAANRVASVKEDSPKGLLWGHQSQGKASDKAAFY